MSIQWACRVAATGILMLAALSGAGVGQETKTKAPLLTKVGVLGDVIQQAELVGDNVLCCLSHSRLLLCPMDNVNKVIDQVFLPSRLPRMFEVYQGIVYLAGQGDSIQIFDVRDGRQIKPVGTLPIRLEHPGRITISGKRLFVPDGPALALRVYSLEQPERPKEVAVCSLPKSGRPQALQVVDGKAYVLSHDYLAVCDVSQPEGAILLGSVPIESNIALGAFTVRPPFAYLLAGHELRILNIEDPEGMFEFDQAKGTWHAYGLPRKNGFMVYSDNGKDYWDLSKPLEPVEASKWEYGGSRLLLNGLDQDFLVEANGQASVAKELTLVKRTGTDRFRSVLGFQKNGDVAYAVGDGTLLTLDISTPERPRVLQSVTNLFTGSTPQAVFDGALVYLPTRIVDCSDSRNPQRLGKLPGENAIAVSPGAVWIAEEKELSVWDVTSPKVPKRLAGQAIEGETEVICLLIRGNKLVVGRKNGLLQIFRIQEDLSLKPIVESKLLMGEETLLRSMRLEGSRLYASLYSRGIVVLDLHRLSDIRIHSEYRASQYSDGFGLRDGKVVVGYGGNGTHLVDMREKGQGKLLASFPSSDSNDGAGFVGDYLYTGEGMGGIGVYRFEKQD
ncbi:MAG: hypothetical protein ACYTGH_12605 [Planctomycetota bacterium]|jgi:hypothetical protein